MDVITFPPVLEDLAFVVAEDVPAGALVDAAREAAGAELRDVPVFDVYRGEQVGPGEEVGRARARLPVARAHALGQDAAVLRGRIVAPLAERFGAELRA